MVSSWILRLLTGVAVLLSANALQVPVADEGLQESQIDLETQVKDLQKNVSDLWVYIYDLRHAMEHHLTHLSQHQKIVEGLVYRMTHQEHHGHSDSHHTDDHINHNDSGHRHDAHHHESESMHDHHDQHADHANADQQHHHDHHSSSENLHDHGSSDSGHHHTSHSDTDHHDDHHNDDHHHGDEHHQETSDHDHHHDEHQTSGGHDHHHSDEHQTSGGHDHHHSDEHQTSGGHDHHHSDEHQTSDSHGHRHGDEHQTSDSHDHHHGDEHHTSSTHDHHGHQATNSHEHHSDHDEYHSGSHAHKDSHENQHDHKDHKDDHKEKQGSLEDQQTQVVEEPIIATGHIHHGQSGHNRLSQNGGNDPLNLLGKHHHHHHHNYHHRHFHKHPQNLTTVSVPKTSDYLLYDFALCEVDANRAIPEEQQQNVKGYASFWQKKSGGPLNIHLRLQGFKVGDHQQHQMHDNEATAHVGGHRHGFHVHASGDLSIGCQSTGPHYNPLNMNHGGPRAAVRHVGDLGNIECDDQGVTNILFSDDVASLSGNYSILGRAIVIHADEDDYGLKQGDPESLLTGNAGIRIACCVIQKVDKLPLKYYKAMKSATQYRN